MGKLLTFIMGAITGGKTNVVTSKVSKDKELVKLIKDTDKSYNQMMKYLKKQYGKEYMKDLDVRATDLTKKQLDL